MTVKDYLLREIRNNRWQEHERILSENELVKTCQVSRMTARRAIKELETEGLLYSIRGKGTFVTPVKAQSSAVELRNIADEIRARQHSYACQVITHQSINAPDIARIFQLAGDTVFYSRVIHFENDHPIQVESRYINPQMVTDYLAIDLQETTANEYLTGIYPVTTVDHQIEAISAQAELAGELDIGIGAACLKLTRMTRDGNAVISMARLYHPGERFMLGTQFEMHANN